METKVNLCRVKVHCLSFMRRLWELTFRVTAVQNWRLSNKYHICAFLFYEFQRPRLDFSGGSRGGAGGATPPPLFLDENEARRAQKVFLFRPPLPPFLDPPLDLTDCQAANQRERLSRSCKGYSFNFTHADFTESWSKKMMKGFEISLACITRVIVFAFLRRAKVT